MEGEEVKIVGEKTISTEGELVIGIGAATPQTLPTPPLTERARRATSKSCGVISASVRSI